ncbi:hypothetical protein [Sandaracinus amylolyticus]|uniref:Integral membrane protein n=1 Tax=Sandaracinus amylolyticus TaxID=927083 RepID=A0A0F6SG76_9BACT|nr:hypothetical protein [Sandaracinus amylolyticus]AKF08209.1 Hypothetical protein DB32_005358 [Sandaracinus amylolyticus]
MKTTTTPTTRAPELALSPRTVYALDTVASAVLGAGMIAVAEPLTELLAWSLPPAFLVVLGATLLPWAAVNAWSARQSTQPAAAFGMHVLVDGGWVLGTLALLVLERDLLSTAGVALLAAQGVAVLGVLVMKLRAGR